MGKKTYCFIQGIAFSKDGERRVTVGENFRVDGGTQEHHEQLVELTQEVSKECKKDAPQTQGEFNMIVRDSMKKVGLAKRR